MNRVNALDATIMKHVLADTTGPGNLMALVGSAVFAGDLFMAKADGQEIRHDQCPRITYFSADGRSRGDKRTALFTIMTHHTHQDGTDAIAQRLRDLLTQGYVQRGKLPKVPPGDALIGTIKDETEEGAVSSSGDIFLKTLKFSVMYTVLDT